MISATEGAHWFDFLHGTWNVANRKLVRRLKEPYEPDRTVPNGTSIAILAEYLNRRVLLAADAHPERLTESLKSLAAEEGRSFPLDAFKLAHD